MVEYMLIEDAKIGCKQGLKNSSIIFEVKALGEVSTGNGNNGPWKKQVVTLQDNSCVFQLTLWNDDIGKLDLHNFYKLENPYWTEYKGEPQVSLGNYHKLHLADAQDLLPGSTTEATTPEPVITKPLPEIPENLEQFVLKEDNLLIQIETVIEANHKKLGLPENGGRVGMHAHEIYLQAKKLHEKH